MYEPLYEYTYVKIVYKDDLIIEGLPDYIADNYGKCDLGTQCKCNRNGWLGRRCEKWRPVKAKNWEELLKEIGG